MKIGHKIKELRLKGGYSQKDLSIKSGLSERTIQRIEKD
jgi:transcriptional regulator with XRE-family HTH domain